MQFNLINLEKEKERLVEFLNKNNISNLNLNIFKAITENDFKKEELVENSLITNDNIYNNPALGCLLSHLTLWNRCIDSNENFTIFEDDSIINDNFYEIINEKIKKVVDFDIIFWGCNIDWPIELQINDNFPKSTIIHDRHMPYKLNKKEKNLDFTLFKIHSFSGSFCYTISPSGAKKIKEMLLPINSNPTKITNFSSVYNGECFTGNWKNSGLDVSISEIISKTNSFLCLPFCAVSKNDHATSSIQK